MCILTYLGVICRGNGGRFELRRGDARFTLVSLVFRSGKQVGRSILGGYLARFPAENELARPERFERPTPWFVATCSIQLSYGRL